MIALPIVLSTLLGVRNLRAFEANLSTIGLATFLVLVPAATTYQYLKAIGYDTDGRLAVCFGIALLCIAPTKVLALIYGLTLWQFEGFLGRRGMPL